VSAGALQCGVRNLYEEPQRLGADRWAALIAARHLHPGAALVVCAGTATTADILDHEGTFQGGLILPGLDLMLQSLARNTAQLPLAVGRFAGLPRNTADAIVSGCLHAQAGAIERMFAQVASYPDAICLVSGGAAPQLFDLLRIPKRQAANLVLEGLVRIGQEA
jgi:type III pantothenate kinase